ncbi:MAG: hypothetical protein V8Q36_09005 [Anaerotignum sp.]
MKKLVLAVCCCAALLGGCGDRYEAKSGLTPYKEELFAMDTYMNIAAYGEQSQKAVEAASAEIQRLDELLSVTGESGDVYQLNQLGQDRWRRIPLLLFPERWMYPRKQMDFLTVPLRR